MMGWKVSPVHGGHGSAPNAYFMTRAARQGRGTFTYMDDVSQVTAQSAKLFAALENPVMTDLVAVLSRARARYFLRPCPICIRASR